MLPARQVSLPVHRPPGAQAQATAQQAGDQYGAAQIDGQRAQAGG